MVSRGCSGSGRGNSSGFVRGNFGCGRSVLGVRREQTDCSLIQVRGASSMVQEDAVGDCGSASLGRRGDNIRCRRGNQ